MFYRCILRDNITSLITLTHCVAYKSELQHCIHVCTSSFFACLLLYASAVCIAHRNALHTSTDPYCILFLPVLIAVPGTRRIEMRGGVGEGPIFFSNLLFFLGRFCWACVRVFQRRMYVVNFWVAGAGIIWVISFYSLYAF